ncbi:unnamed protein product [Ambrosiozyma monospora]|uniref:Unnamed protein product n=1 Tax=Ambrosiozyma monospora TaxID=43982 RepID=A0A9W7DCI9_AMBMO|nr:unnamed protein product [Ambrosiozyma monospora]
MAVGNLLTFPNLTGKAVASISSNEDEKKMSDPEKSATDESPAHIEKTSDSDDLDGGNNGAVESLDTDVGLGTKKAQAMSLVWTKKALYITYAWIWVCFFMLNFHATLISNVIYYAYNTFAQAPQVNTANILATIVGGVINVPVAKLTNVWGRAEGLAIFLIIYMIGIIVNASCTGPSGYAAGYCLYYVGFAGIGLILNVFVADTSGLKNRAFFFAFSYSPLIATSFLAPLAATAYINGPGWRWTYYSFFIISPFIYGPLIVIFKYYERKARKLGHLADEKTGRNWLESCLYYIHEFDIIGAFILMASFILFLLPFSLQSYGRAQYKSAKFIVMIIIGGLLFPVFFMWEKYFAKVHLIKWRLLKDPTLLGAAFTALALNFSVCSWNLYFYNFCMVVYNMSITHAGYMNQIYIVGYTFWSVLFGIWIKFVGRFKYTCLGFGLPLILLGSGLLYHFSIHQEHVGLMIMSQIFISFGGGTLILGYEMAVMAASDLDGIPMMLSIVYLFASVGMALGGAVSTAVYNNTFLTSLINHLPADFVTQAADLFLGGYTSQMMYPPGDPVRDAINFAWGDYQKKTSISAICSLIIAIPGITIWKNYSVKRKQNKGTTL